MFPNKYAICIFQKGVRKVYVGDYTNLFVLAILAYNLRLATPLRLF